ncbi:Gfo/Idh/MocA family protein [Desertihabitans aurantiacus]|uniref:Gfo/Idh/MocA family protein n=1 Tax=Desertihabitans aurantiacus TaxID=2282477 RepID=UPI000DF7CD05|nr:Gfo/Idh/MocA family oxidoreductase [Desertihabitans aurantiacus]
MTFPEQHPDPAYQLGPPADPRPIVVVGAGGIVRDAHLPAYRKAGFDVHALVDVVRPRAEELAARFGVRRVFGSVADAVAAAPPEAVYDVALMPEQFEPTLRALPEGSAVLLQKPLGHHLEETRRLQRLVRERGLVAAVNTQLRFAPYVQVARRLVAEGTIGELVDLEIRICVETHWELFPQVFTLDRLELNMHSVHYLDLVRSFLGQPASVSAVTVPHPDKPHPNTRTAVLLHYPDRPLRVVVSTNHDHDLGPEHQASSITWQGTRGALRAQLGLLLDYPRGGLDRLQLATPGQGWSDVDFTGSWFPDAFIGSMSALQNVVTGRTSSLPTSVDDVARTMALVEAAHTASRRGGVVPEPTD